MLTSRGARIAGLACAVLLALAAAMLSLLLGPVPISFATVIDAVTDYDPGAIDHLVLATERVSRVATASVVGASLAVAGALMQALTRNALASPGILGVNAGAMFFVVLAAALFTLSSPQQYVWAAYAGAAIAGAIVYLVGHTGRAAQSPLQLILAGVAVTALFVSFGQGLLIANQERFQSILFWLAGSVSGRELALVTPLLPGVAGAAVLCALLVRHLNLFAVDDEIATSLGQRTALVKLLVAAIVVVLAGGAVALAGMVGFVGLIVPHMVRALFGMDHRWVLPGSAALGAALLLFADALARVIIPPQEIPVGVMTALLGTPFFIYLARRKRTAL